MSAGAFLLRLISVGNLGKNIKQYVSWLLTGSKGRRNVNESTRCDRD